MGSVEFILRLMKELGNFMQGISMSQCFPTSRADSLLSTGKVETDFPIFDYCSIVQHDATWVTWPIQKSGPSSVW